MACNGPPPGPTCESCGDRGRPLHPVHRVYLEGGLHPEGGAGGALRVAGVEAAVEWWCPSCVAQYPNRPAGGDEHGRPGRGAGAGS